LRELRASLRSKSAIRSSLLGDLGQPTDRLIHAQQDRDHRLAALRVDRLSLSALHTPGIRRPPPKPLTH